MLVSWLLLHAVVARPRFTTGPASESSKLPVDRRLALELCFSPFIMEGSCFCILAETASDTESERWRVSIDPFGSCLVEDCCVLAVPISSRLRFRIILDVDCLFLLVLVQPDIDLLLLEGDFGLRSDKDGGQCFEISGR